MEISEAMRTTDRGTEVDVTVSPRSNRSCIDGFDEWRKRIVVRVKSPPLEGRANKEVASVLSDATGFKSEVVSGLTSHQKTVLVKGDMQSICAAISRNVRSTTTNAPR